MYTKYLILLTALWWSADVLWAQNSLTGTVLSAEGDKLKPLYLANAYLPGTAIGAYTNEKGEFELTGDFAESNLLVFSFVGLRNDTTSVEAFRKAGAQAILQSGKSLSEFEISTRAKTTSINHMDLLKVEQMSEKELKKAPCCNLSESFETNPSVDVSFTDAISGTKQIQMLGLSGKYSLISKELMPDGRLNGSGLGLSLIPGPWLEAIQVSKGTGTVKTGTESMTGQINYELKKPETFDEERIFINGYWNVSGRTELNVIARQKVTNKISTAILAHGNFRKVKWDMNGDRFLDNPLQEQINLLNRWKYQGKDGLEAQAGLWYITDERNGGQIGFNENQDLTPTNPYGFFNQTERWNTWLKTGYVFDDMASSIGLQLDYTRYKQDLIVGLNEYNSSSASFYGNAMYQRDFNAENSFTAGVMITKDDMQESFENSAYHRNEIMIGPHLEYTQCFNDKISVQAGLRYDYHNNYGGLWSPRLHARWEVAKRAALRASAGIGSRTANIFAENFGLMASSRQWFVLSSDLNNPYGLEREVSSNLGLNFTQNFTLDYRDGFFTIDVYRLDFINQVVVDLDVASNALFIYNLNGQSYSNNLQLTAEYEALKFFDVRLAYRYVDVKTDFVAGLLSNPQVAPHRGFINLAYETKTNTKGGKWSFDLTAQITSKQRLPGGETYKAGTANPEFGEAYAIVNTQVMRIFSKKLEVYVGIENLNNFTQPNPIIDANNPFGNNFDATQIWAPIFGRMLNTGFRISI